MRGLNLLDASSGASRNFDNGDLNLAFPQWPLLISSSS